MRGLRRSTQRARNKGKIAQGAAIQMNHFLLNVEMSEWRSSTEQDVSPAHWAGSNEICGAVPSSSASARSASLGEMRSQSSNADCRVEATANASVARLRSDETTKRRPSRPALRDASFMSASYFGSRRLSLNLFFSPTP